MEIPLWKPALNSCQKTYLTNLYLKIYVLKVFPLHRFQKKNTNKPHNRKEATLVTN